MVGAQDISSHAEIERYLRALADAAPDRTRLVRYGQTIEKRGLYYLVITASKNLTRLDEIREANLRLADPRTTTPEQAKAIVETTPAIVWMAYGVHGDEISSGDAALLTAYHLLADRRPVTRGMLEKVVVIIDPMQNPDGRDRFVNFHRAEPRRRPRSRAAGGRAGSAVGHRPVQSLPLRHEPRLVPPDPGRDQDQESPPICSWQPHVTIDAHEMGSNSEYYFDPPADPILELITPKQREWFGRFGTQAGPAVRSVRLPLHHPRGLRRLLSRLRLDLADLARLDRNSLGTGRGARAGHRPRRSEKAPLSRRRQASLCEQHLDRRDGRGDGQRAGHRIFMTIAASAIALGRDGPVREYVLLPGSTPARAARLAEVARRQRDRGSSRHRTGTVKAKGGIEARLRRTGRCRQGVITSPSPSPPDGWLARCWTHGSTWARRSASDSSTARSAGSTMRSTT